MRKSAGPSDSGGNIIGVVGCSILVRLRNRPNTGGWYLDFLGWGF